MNKKDFIIVGSWIAWLSAAIFAAKKWSVLLITKEDSLCWWSSYLAQWWIAATQNFDLHIADTMKVSWNTSDLEVVKFFVEKAADAFLWLRDEIWVKFNDIATVEWGHSERRVRTTWDDSWKVISKALSKYIESESNIKILKSFRVDKLIMEKNLHKKKVIWVSWVEISKRSDYYWNYIILATWWNWQSYEKTTNPISSTWDWLKMAKDIWVKIINEHWVQWHPTCFNINKNPLPLLTETLRGEWAYIVNKNWERFLRKYHEDWELAPRDIISNVLKQEEIGGNWSFLDLRHKPKNFWKNRFPNIVKLLEDNGLDISIDLIPITSAQHYLCWWIEVDKYAKTSIEWLYAIWEVSCTGLHWKNRLPSNSLAECVVWAKSFVDNV